MTVARFYLFNIDITVIKHPFVGILER